MPMIEAGQVYHVHVFEQVITVGLQMVRVLHFEVGDSFVRCTI